jgi:hypothetical protein
MQRELGALTKSGKTLGVRSFYSGDPNMITWSCQSVWLRNTHSWHVMDVLTCLADSLAQRHGRQNFSTKPRPCAVPKRYGRMSTVEKPAETQTSIQLASHLVRAPNSRSGGHEFESPMRRKLDELTKSGKTPGVWSFYNITIFFVIANPTELPTFTRCPKFSVHILHLYKSLKDILRFLGSERLSKCFCLYFFVKFTEIRPYCSLITCQFLPQSYFYM